MEQESKFWDRLAEKYARQPIADEAAYQKKLNVTREYFRPDMLVLEVGCGTGSTAISHAPYVKHIHATDFSKKMIEIAERKAAAQAVENITFEQSSIDQLSAKEGAYDAVLALSVLHLLENKDDAIRTIQAMLKSGGVFITSTACLGDTMKFFKYIGPIGKALGFFPTVKVFTSDELKQSLINGGFEIDYEWRPAKGKSVFIVAKKP